LCSDPKLDYLQCGILSLCLSPRLRCLCDESFLKDVLLEDGGVHYLRPQTHRDDEDVFGSLKPFKSAPGKGFEQSCR